MVSVDDVDGGSFDDSIQRRVYDVSNGFERKRLGTMISSINDMVLSADRVEYLGSGFVSVFVNDAVFHFRMGRYSRDLLFVDRVIEELDDLDGLF